MPPYSPTMPLAGGGRLRARWTEDNTDRSESLDRLRQASAHSLPWIVPPEGQQPDDGLQESYQSIGSRGAQSTIGKLMLALYPLDYPWAQLEVDTSILHALPANDELLVSLQKHLFLRELMIRTALEQGVGSHATGPDFRRMAGFRTQKRKSIANLVVTGDTLERLTPEYRLVVYARHQYVTSRDSNGSVQYHGVWERIDPLQFSEDVLAASGLKSSELKEKSPRQRQQDFFTFTEYQPWTRTWVVEHELNGKIIDLFTREEKVSDFFATAFELGPGDNYGHGPIELNLGDLRTLNEGEKALNDFMFAASKFLWFIDENSNVRDTDLAKRSGSVVRGARVRGGTVEDVAIGQTNKFQDFSVVGQRVQDKRKSLAGALMLQDAAVRDSERTTATEIDLVVRELDGVLGSLYAPIAEEQQQPLAERVLHMLVRDKYLEPLDRRAYRIAVQTGIAALSRAQQKTKLLRMAEIAQRLGPEAIADINIGALFRAYRYYESIHIPGLEKTPEQKAAEQQQALALQAQAQAAETAITTAGAIAQSSATQPTAGV
jgi:hypothetical protein